MYLIYWSFVDGDPTPDDAPTHVTERGLRKLLALMDRPVRQSYTISGSAHWLLADGTALDVYPA